MISGKIVTSKNSGEFKGNNRDYAYLALKQNFDDLGDYDAAGLKFERIVPTHSGTSLLKARAADQGSMQNPPDTLRILVGVHQILQPQGLERQQTEWKQDQL